MQVPKLKVLTEIEYPHWNLFNFFFPIDVYFYWCRYGEGVGGKGGEGRVGEEEIDQVFMQMCLRDLSSAQSNRT